MFYEIILTIMQYNINVNIQPNTLRKTSKTTRCDFYADKTGISPKRIMAVENTRRFNAPIRRTTYVCSRYRSVRLDVYYDLRVLQLCIM